MQAENSFISIVTDKNFSSKTEDRLTQVIVAVFQSSIEFRKIFTKFLGINEDVSDLWLNTREAQDDRKKPDLVIYKNNKSIAVIECKTLSKLRLGQLKSYQNIATKRYILTIYPESYGLVPDGWKRKSWGELLNLMQQTVIRDKIQKWLIQQLAKYLAELGVVEMSSLTQKDLDKIALFFRSIRFERLPRVKASGVIKRLPVLELMLLEGLEIASTEVDVRKYFGKKLRPNIWLSWAWENEEEQSWPYLNIGLLGLDVIGHKTIKKLSITLVVRKKTGRAVLKATLWGKRSKGDKRVGSLRELKSIPIKFKKEIGPRDLASQIKKEILPELRG
jgi:hypothetical protein